MSGQHGCATARQRAIWRRTAEHLASSPLPRFNLAMPSRRPQKITFGEMRAAGVRNVLIGCTDHRCGHCITVEASADRWPDDVRLSDIEDNFVCSACGERGADVRPDWQTAVRISPKS